MSVAHGHLLSRYQEGWGLRVSQHFAVPPAQKIQWELAANRAQFHHRGIEYRVPAAIRAAAFALEHPTYAVTGFGALALYGLTYFVDGCDVVLMGSERARSQAAGAIRPKLVRGTIPAAEQWTVVCAGQHVPIAAPGLAVVQALQVLRRGECGWEVLRICDESFLRAVQLIDACLNQLHLDPIHIIKSARNRLDARWLMDVLAASSALADSPKETEMRLIAAKIADKHGLILREQVPVYRGKQIITSFDLVLCSPDSRLQVGLMYDGGHHGGHEQLQKDSLINIELAALGWRQFRFASKTLPLMFDRLDSFFTEQLEGTGS